MTNDHTTNHYVICPICKNETKIQEYINHLAGNGHFEIACCFLKTSSKDHCFILDMYKPKKSENRTNALNKIQQDWKKLTKNLGGVW